jgi:hypothetical protein
MEVMSDTRPSRPRRRRPAHEASATQARRVITTTIRLYSDQRDALQRAALDRRAAEGTSGRPDSSALLRELLDQAGLRGA